jgi:hypothetical protein
MYILHTYVHITYVHITYICIYYIHMYILHTYVHITYVHITYVHITYVHITYILRANRINLSSVRCCWQRSISLLPFFTQVYCFIQLFRYMDIK